MREQILKGILELPNRDDFYQHLQTANMVERMFISAWHSYLHSKSPINLTFWSKEFMNPKEFNTALKILSDGGWFISHSIPARNWAEAELNENKLLEFVTVEELAHVRATHKFAKYVPCFRPSQHATLTRMNGKIKRTGLTRYGFQASSATPFQFDTNYLSKYKDTIVTNTIKGMTKVRDRYPDMNTDEASYDTISVEVINHLLNNPSTYSMGSNFSDPRGRAVKEGLSKVANPIGYKDFRALLVIPEEFRNKATEKGVKAIYLFIAELLGHKGGTPVDKELFGFQCYSNRTLHKLDLEDEEDRKELFENIWLERLYDEIDQYYSTDCHYWSTPVEKDASASMLSHIGLLLGDKNLLEMTNTSFTGEFRDPWTVEGVERKAIKATIMPMIYASSKASHELLQDKNIKYTLEGINALNKALTTGAFGAANSFKEFILRWVKPQPEMEVHVYEDKFQVECNRFRNVGETTLRYDIYDSETDSIRRVTHTDTKRVPDLKQFRRWFVTGLIHSQDSQVLDFVMEKVIDKYQWGIDIHDAIIVCPEAVEYTAEVYADELQVIYDNRETILNNYFKSIGIGSEALHDWKRFQSKVTPIKDFKASPMALK